MDDEIISITSIRYNLEDCISKTNITIQRWKLVNQVKSEQILDEEVRSIILNLIRKYIIIEKSDFSRFRKIFEVRLDTNNKFIDNIIIKEDKSSYYKKDYIIKELIRVSSKINYILLYPKDDQIESVKLVKNKLQTLLNTHSDLQREIQEKEKEFQTNRDIKIKEFNELVGKLFDKLKELEKLESNYYKVIKKEIIV